MSILSRAAEKQKGGSGWRVGLSTGNPAGVLKKAARNVVETAKGEFALPVIPAFLDECPIVLSVLRSNYMVRRL